MTVTVDHLIEAEQQIAELKQQLNFHDDPVKLTDIKERINELEVILSKFETSYAVMRRRKIAESNT